jgi:hypothetical protein
MDGESLMKAHIKILTGVIISVVSLAGSIAFAAERLGGSQKSDAPPVRYAKTTHSNPDAYQGMSSERILDAIVRRSRTTSLAAASLGAPPDWAQEVGAPGDASWAYFTVEVDRLGPHALRAIWEADLVGAALRDALMIAHKQALLSTTITLSSGSGEVLHETSGALGNVEHGQLFRVSSEQGVRERIAAAAGRNGLDLSRFEVLLADQPAPRVRLATDDPKGFVEHASKILQEIFGPSDTYEGTYAEVVDSSGELVYVAANTLRSGVGRTWVRPDLDPRRRR